MCTEYKEAFLHSCKYKKNTTGVQGRNGSEQALSTFWIKTALKKDDFSWKRVDAGKYITVLEAGIILSFVSSLLHIKVFKLLWRGNFLPLSQLLGTCNDLLPRLKVSPKNQRAGIYVPSIQARCNWKKNKRQWRILTLCLLFLLSY